MITNIECAKCKESKPQTEYYFDTKRNKYKSYCKDCHIGTVMHSRINNKRKCSIDDCGRPHYALDYCRMHHARFRYGNKNNLTRQFNGATDHPRNLRKYGITAEDFKEMSQDGCQICKVKEGAFVLDHDHNCCNEIPYCGECTRGYICQSCNISVSKYEQGKIRETNPKKDSIVGYLVNHDIRLKQKESK